MLILAVFVFGYGVAAQALRYPNAELSWNILRNVVYMPYWHIYGELFLDEMQGMYHVYMDHLFDFCTVCFNYVIVNTAIGGGA